MLKGTFAALFLVAVTLTAVVTAQESVTLTLRSGETMNAQLVDLGGVGFTVRVSGQERQIPTSEVALINFTGGSMSSSDWDRLNSGTQVLWLKSGEVINGQLTDIGGTTPLRITFRTSSGERDFSSSDISRIALARPNTGTNIDNPPVPGGAGITVSSQQAWTPTGLTVRRGDTVSFTASGEIHIGGPGNPSVSAAGIQAAAPGAPMANAPAGALIGRVGNGTPFLIGNGRTMRMPNAGQLFVGINDGHLPDNDGAFQVQVSRR